MIIEPVAHLTPYRDRVIAVKLSEDELKQFKRFSSIHGLPPSTVAYLLVKRALHQFDDTKNDYNFDGLL